MPQQDPEIARHGAAAVVMVQATPEAEAICQKSQLNAVDMLRPFGFIEQSFEVTTVGERYRLRTFSMRFVHTSEFQEVDHDNCDRHLTRLLESYDCSTELSDAEKRDLDAPPTASPLPPLMSTTTSWLSAFREQLAVSLRHADGATLDHPVGCMLFASVTETRLVNVFNALASQASMASVIADGSADPAMPRTYILLHDLSSGAASAADAQNALKEISRAFGPSACHLLPFNSRKAGEAPPEDVWTRARPVMHAPPSSAPPKPLPADSPLSAEDAKRLQTLVESALVKQVRAAPRPGQRMPAAGPPTQSASGPSGPGPRPPPPHRSSSAAPPASEAGAHAHLPPRRACPPLPRLARARCAPLHRPHRPVPLPPLAQIIASLSSRVVALSSTVKAARAGVANRMRAFFGGKTGHSSSGPSTTGTGGAVKYICGSIEAQTRQLADCAFLLGDYATALTHYRQASNEFKNDKAWKHYAVSQEMVALCLHATDGAWKDMDQAAETAAATYLKLTKQPGDRPARHATRAVLLQMDLLVHVPPKKREAATRDVAQALVAQSTQEAPLCAALLLEQAALCFRSSRMPMQRKYAFHLILAGYRYISCAQRRHAVRAYAAALRVYAGKGWSHVEDHVHFTLGRNCSQLGKIELALAYFLRLLHHSRQPAERQQTFVRELGAILRTHPQHSSLRALPLPRFASRSIRVLLNDHNQPSGTQSSGLLSALHPLWQPLTKPLLPADAGGGGNWLTGKLATAAKEVHSPCVLGEWVYVEIELENPMHVQLHIGALQLACTLTPDPNAPPPQVERAASGAADAEGAKKEEEEMTDPLAHPAPSAADGSVVVAGVPVSGGKDSLFETSVESLLLPAGRRSLVRLGVRPLCEGEMRVDGVTWTLNDVAHGTHALVLHGKRLNQTKAQRVGKVYAFDQSLSMKVVQPMPLLQASIEGLPSTLLYGQIATCTLVLCNVGRTPLNEIKLRLSQPAFCVLGDPEPELPDEGERRRASVARGGVTILSCERPTHTAEGRDNPPIPTAAELSALAARPGGGKSQKEPKFEPPDWSMLSLPLPSGELRPGDTLRMPLHVRAAALGAHSLHFVFCYQPLHTCAALKRRLCPLSAKLRVHPSLNVRYVLRPVVPRGQADGSAAADAAESKEDDGRAAPEYALCLHVQNVATSARLRVCQVSAISAGWDAAPLSPALAQPSLLEPTEANALYLRLAPRASAVAAAAAAAADAAETAAAAAAAKAAPSDFLSIRAAIAAATAAAVPSAMAHSEIIFSGSQPPIDSRLTPHLGALLRQGAPAVTEADGEMQYGRKPRTRELSAAEVGAREGLSLLVHWLDAEGGARGQLHLTGLLPQPLLLAAAAPSPRASLGVPAAGPAVGSTPLDAGATLRVHVEARARVAHPFGTSPLCELPLTLIVQNCDRAAAVGFTLDLAQIGVSPQALFSTGGAGGVAAAAATSLHAPAATAAALGVNAVSASSTAPPSEKIAAERVPSGEAFWLGCTRIAEQWVEPSGVATLPLRLAVCSAGTYTLDGFRLAVCGWKVGASAEPQRPAAPVACPPPPACTVQVVDGVA